MEKGGRELRKAGEWGKELGEGENGRLKGEGIEGWMRG